MAVFKNVDEIDKIRMENDNTVNKNHKMIL